jgi:hypothetical protein
MKWNKCKDIMPDTSEDCLISNGQGGYTVAWYSASGMWLTNVDLLEAANYDGRCSINIDGDIIEWMYISDIEGASDDS